jgi:hypothetical protein
LRHFLASETHTADHSSSPADGSGFPELGVIQLSKGKMMRNFKVLGLILAMGFTMNAVVTSVAQANQFHSASTETELTVASNEDQKYLYETGGRTVKCTKVAGSGEALVQTASEAIFKPEYSGCTVDGIAFSSAEVTMSGCTFQTTVNAGANEGSTHVTCTGTSQVTITVKVFGVSVCTFHIGKQTPKGLTKYFNSGSSQIKVQANQTGVVGSKQGSSECGAATSTTGTVTATVVLKGVKPGTQTQTSIQVG